jgi:hypothetical protein
VKLEKTDYLPKLIGIVLIILIILLLLPNSEYKLNLFPIMIGLFSILVGLFIATSEEEFIKTTAIIVIGVGIWIIIAGIISTFFISKLKFDITQIVILISAFAIGLGSIYKGLSELKAKHSTRARSEQVGENR